MALGSSSGNALAGCVNKVWLYNGGQKGIQYDAREK